jgi:selenocysteine lyase/cysteine desulfurase
LQCTPQEMIEMSTALQEKNIWIAVRCGGFRISPYLTNTEADIQRLIEALSKVSPKRSI